MQESKAPYVVERLNESGELWVPVARCRSLRYAAMVADAGLRRHVGCSYRAVSLMTGTETALATTTAEAA